MDNSAEGRLKSVGNTMPVPKNSREHREQLQKFPLKVAYYSFSETLLRALRLFR